MKKTQIIFFSILVLFTILFTACGSWTESSLDADNCDYGKRLAKIVGNLTITPRTDYSTTLWNSYNGEHCGKEVGQAVGDYDAEWYQIVSNASGNLMINVYAFEKEKNDFWPGWVYCSEVTFKDKPATFEDKLTSMQYDLLVQCFEVSNK